MSSCSTCGTDIEKDSNYCWKCGTPKSRDVGTSKKDLSLKKRLVLPIVALILLIGLFTFFKGFGERATNNFNSEALSDVSDEAAIIDYGALYDADDFFPDISGYKSGGIDSDIKHLQDMEDRFNITLVSAASGSYNKEGNAGAFIAVLEATSLSEVDQLFNRQIREMEGNRISISDVTLKKSIVGKVRIDPADTTDLVLLWKLDKFLFILIGFDGENKDPLGVSTALANGIINFSSLNFIPE